jgi:hypothetical protein
MLDVRHAPKVHRVAERDALGIAPPRRSPGPPARRSIAPRSRQSYLVPYQPVAPPIRSIAANASAGLAAISISRRLVNTVPPAQSRSPGIGPASDQSRRLVLSD